jgi:hypothetical protein
MLLRQLRRAAIALLAAASCAAMAAGAVKNKPPTVALTSPANGATFNAPATVQLAATASDADGTVAKVEFFRGKTLIGTVTAAPYNLTWANVAAGSYSITAKATDNAGAATTSTAVSIAVQAVTNAPPTVSLTSPTNGASFAAPATIQLSANAADADGGIAKVEFFRGGTTLVGTALAAPYTFTWTNVALGSYSITAKATDNAGAVTTSAAATVNVVNASTLTTITSPTPGAALPWTITDVSGTFSGAADTTVLVSNGANGTVLATLTGTTTFVARNVPLVQGANTLTATAIRRDGTSSSGSVTVDVPQRLVVLTSPSKDATYQSPPSLTFQASALLSSGSVQRIDYYEHSPFTGSVTRLGTASVPPFTFVWNSPPKGTHNVYAWLLDDKNIGRQSTEIQFTVVGPNVPPSVTLTAPANNAVFAAPASFALQASATDSDGSVSQVEFLQNGQVLASTNVAPYGFAVSNLAVGSYSFAARATDDKGATTTSAPVAVNVAAPPQVTMSTSAASGRIQAGGSVTLTGDASSAQGAIARVEFYANSVLIGSATAAPYSFTWTNVPLGAYQLTAKAIDTYGLATTSAPVALSAVPGPNVGLTSPAAGTSYFIPASITLSASADSTSGNVVSVAFFDNGTPIGTVTTAPFTLLWSNATPGSHALTAVATDEQGFSSTSAVVNVTVVSASLTIASPLSGASVPNTGVLVRGHISAPKYSGVVVNGQIAYVDASGDFYANDVVPLSEDNGIHVTLSTPDEVLVTATVVVTPVAPAPTSTDLKIGDTEALGLIKAVWTLKNPIGVRDVTFDYWGDGTVILKLSDDPGYVPGGTGKTLALTYSAYGVFKPIVTVEDMLGNIYRKQFVLQARSVAEIDTMLKDLWARMLGKLKAADIPGALTAVTGAGRQRFQAIFENLQPNPSVAVDQLGTLTGSQFGVDSAEYVVIRQKADGPTGYPIYFIRSNDGVWRVDAM